MAQLVQVHRNQLEIADRVTAMGIASGHGKGESIISGRGKMSCQLMGELYFIPVWPWRLPSAKCSLWVR